MKTVIEMAGKVDAVTKVLLDRKEPQGMSHDVFVRFLEHFAELVRADEREHIITKNTPEIERCNSHIKALEQEILRARNPK